MLNYLVYRPIKFNETCRISYRNAIRETSLLSTEPAPIVLPLPMRTLIRIVTSIPIHTSGSICLSLKKVDSQMLKTDAIQLFKQMRSLL
jgi:hypothetical protein